MAVLVNTAVPQQLYNAIKESIDNDDIRTWIVLDDSGEEYLSHVEASDQWECKAFFKAHIETSNNRIVFAIHGLQNEDMTDYIYAVYHGKLIQMLLAHFDKKFSFAGATAHKLQHYDNYFPE